MASQPDRQFIFRCTLEAKDFLLRKGTDLKYGARHLKRAIERHLVYPISNLIATGQIELGNLIKVDLEKFGEKLVFSKEAGVADMPRQKNFTGIDGSLVTVTDELEI